MRKIDKLERISAALKKSMGEDGHNEVWECPACKIEKHIQVHQKVPLCMHNPET